MGCDKCKKGHGYKKTPHHGCGEYEHVKCGCTEIIYKPGTARVKCDDKYPCIAGYYLICHEQTIENNYETTPCGSVDLTPTVRCLVVQIVQSFDDSKFGTMQILNVTDSCPILLQLVENGTKDYCNNYSMIGAGGNAARTYDFKLDDVKCSELKCFSYTFVQGFSVIDANLSFQAATGCGKAERVCESDVPSLIAKYTDGQCGVGY